MNAHTRRLVAAIRQPEKASYPALLELWRSLPAEAEALQGEAGERFLAALVAARRRAGRHARGIERRIPWREPLASVRREAGAARGQAKDAKPR